MTEKNKVGIIRVEPVPLRASSPRKGPPRTFYRWIAAGILSMVFVLLVAGTWFVFTARQVTIDIDPAPDHVSIGGGLPAIRMGNYYLIRSGNYSLEARRPCYRLLKKQLSVSKEKHQKVLFHLQPLPGYITFDIQPADGAATDILGLQMFIDGQKSDLPSGAEITLQPGKRQVEIRSENYQMLTTPVEVEGCDRRQTFSIRLKPDWAQVSVDSVPSGGVWIDGRQVGQTPLALPLKSGSHRLEIRALGFQTWRTDLNVVAGKPIEIAAVHLRPADAKVHLSSTPPGANVLVGNRYAGATPLVLSLEPSKEHTIRLNRAGYEKSVRRVKLAAGEEKKMRVRLSAREGIVELAVIPADAELVIDGRSRGQVANKIRMPVGSHHLEIRKKDYFAFQTTITVRPGYPRKIKVSLKKRGEDGTTGENASLIIAANGYKLKLIRTGPFTMGSSRREQGRLSNETLRQVKLKRPFYMGLQEVTNREFKTFKATHQSGEFGSQNLTGDTLPVVKVTWQEAALFCNWLSLRESLDPVYVMQGGQLVAQTPLGTGYRLPTEAEWAYGARLGSGTKGSRYPWGNRFPPISISGNYADESARQLLTDYITGYNDGYPVTAPVGSFTASQAGLFDMAGNVAEWCHDVYFIYPYQPDRVDTDPTGPAEGGLHVIRGSSWKHGSITTLRLAYRDYGRKPRLDLGFRIARYAR